MSSGELQPFEQVLKEPPPKSAFDEKMEMLKAEKKRAGVEVKPSELKEDMTPDNMEWDKIPKLLQGIRDFMMSFAGKDGHNPFLWIRDNLYPLEARFEDGERTPELYQKILNVEIADPAVKNPKVMTLREWIAKGYDKVHPWKTPEVETKK